MTLGHVGESRAPIPLTRARARTAVPHSAAARATRAPALGGAWARAGAPRSARPIGHVWSNDNNNEGG
eukprot:1349667-Pleurochrysis_carterae.AAC.1